MKHATLLLLTLAACFGVQSAALRLVGGRTAKNESNYHSSLGRIQAGTVGTPGIMLLGSSMTGRLPDRANGFTGVANLGCDGGSAVDALRAMDRGLLPAAPVLVIEANTLHRAMDPLPSEVGAAMNHAWFQAGMRVPAISSYARPSGFFYSALLARKIGGYGDPVNGADLGVASHPSKPAFTQRIGESRPEVPLIRELAAIIHRLREKGHRTVMVWLPPARISGEKSVPDWIQQLVMDSGSEWWDLGQEAPSDRIELTDGVHMAATTAARTVITIKRGIKATAP